MQKRKRPLFFIPSVLLFSLVFLAIVAFFGLEYYATTTVKQEIDNTIEELSKHVLVQYDNLGVNWLAFTVNLEKVKLSKPPLPGMITIDKVSVRDLTSIGIRWIPTVVVFDNIALKNEDATVSIKQLVTTFSLNRIPTQEEAAEDWTVFLDNLLAGNVKLKQVEFSDKTTQFQFDMAEADYAFANGNHRNSNLTINNLKLQQEGLQFHVDNFFLASSLDQNNVVNHISKKVKNFSFQFPTTLVKSNNILQKLTALGYDQLIVGIDLDYDYQPETKDLSITWDASATNLGRLQFDLLLTDYHSPPVPLNGGLVEFLAFLEKLRTPAQKASLQGIKAVYHDFGLVPRLIKAEAQSRGKSSEEFTQNLVGTINTSLLFLPLPASIKEQIYAVNRFLQNPKKIQLIITCKKPLPLKNLEEGSVAGLLELLENTEVKITTK
jgi:hypothetical protein